MRCAPQDLANPLLDWSQKLKLRIHGSNGVLRRSWSSCWHSSIWPGSSGWSGFNLSSWPFWSLAQWILELAVSLIPTKVRYFWKLRKSGFIISWSFQSLDSMDGIWRFGGTTADQDTPRAMIGSACSVSSSLLWPVSWLASTWVVISRILLRTYLSEHWLR